MLNKRLKNGFLQRLFLIILILICVFSQANAQVSPSDTLTSRILPRKAWVDSVFATLSTDEKIAQLLVVRANYPNEKYFKEINQLIRKYNIGGVTFFGSTPYRQMSQTNYWQSISRTPLFITIDGEWGLGMRLDSVMPFPFQMTLGALRDDSLVYEMGKAIAAQCKRMGIQMNFAPVVDVNVNPANPVINMRSFGEDPLNVAEKGTAYMKGLQDHGIIATAKHFPGHGDTETDSHQTLPIVNHDWTRIDSIELFPFKQLIKEGVDGIMIAHLYMPAIENQPNTATTLSKNVVSGLLTDALNFDGLIVTDALDMKGVTKYFPPGDIEIKALQAGNDILLLPQDVKKAIQAIKKAIKQGNILQETIDKRCRKVLGFKYDAGLHTVHPITGGRLTAELNKPENRYLNRELYANAITLVKNDNDIIPLKNLDTLQIATISIGTQTNNHFQHTIGKYTRATHFNIQKKFKKKEEEKLISDLSPYNLIIIGINNTNIFASRNFGVTKESISLIEKIAETKTVILDVFASPYALAFFKNIENIEAILVSYQDNRYSQDLSGQLLLGGIPARGKLPVTASSDFPINTGIFTDPVRIKFTSPEEFRITERSLKKIDSVALSGIEMKAYPGCQVIAAKDGKIFYNRSFGNHTYKNGSQVRSGDLYDLASVTKLAATTLSMMKLHEEGKIDIDNKLEKYLPFLRGTEKGDIVIRELMAHQAGLQAWIPYYMFTLDESGNPDQSIYSSEISEEFPVRVAEDMYIRKEYSHTIFDSIMLSPPRENHDYKYSDLGFYYLAKIIENTSNKPFEEYVDEVFYKPLGLSTMTFLPRRKYELGRIVPTENDKQFRQQLLQGDVHDPGAAMLGGVSGHAGLFSNAEDLVVILQMLLQKGHYGGEQYLDTLTIKEFTKCQFPLNLNRRGIGFDKPLLEFVENGPNCKSASPSSYGHSGFTGTYVWADPENNLVYIFLSNRIHPNASNGKIMKYDIRTNLHEAIYEALRESR